MTLALVLEQPLELQLEVGANAASSENLDGRLEQVVNVRSVASLLASSKNKPVCPASLTRCKLQGIVPVIAQVSSQPKVNTKSRAILTEQYMEQGRTKFGRKSSMAAPLLGNARSQEGFVDKKTCRCVLCWVLFCWL